MAEIPDPTIDLGWSNFEGAIHEHFHKNARAQPSRTCVVETKSSTSPTRTFDYKQIFEAANTISHHLRDAGITNGDVVMIFANRTVELVCAFMGVLVRYSSA
jgi:L-aminoadipate-semialdehyde dehydrogenase